MTFFGIFENVANDKRDERGNKQVLKYENFFGLFGSVGDVCDH